MKFVLAAALCIVAYAAAAPAEDYIPIVRSEADVSHDGHFSYSYESADGSKAEQSGELRQFDKDTAAVVVHGHNSYKGDDGKDYSITYVADENGYQPQGDHLPVAPEIPEAIVRALKYIAEHPYKDDSKH